MSGRTRQPRLAWCCAAAVLCASSAIAGAAEPRRPDYLAVVQRYADAMIRHGHYEAITRADTLAMALLDLWAAQNKPELKLGLVNAER